MSVKLQDALNEMYVEDSNDNNCPRVKLTLDSIVFGWSDCLEDRCFICTISKYELPYKKKVGK